MRAAAFALALSIAATAAAQEGYRRPFDEGYTMNYGYDHNGGAGGCADYECGGACYDTHEGSDFGCPYGTNVLVGANGVVSFVSNGCADYGYVGNSCGSYCGNYVRVDHDDGSRTIYCHLRNDTISVSVGQRVSCGQYLGQSASSGSSSGPHLHFGFRATTGSAYSDPFAGACSPVSSRWVEQASYRQPPSTACSCVASAETCNGRDDDCDGSADEDDVCDIALLHAESGSYAPPTTTDLDGDGRDDVCARGSDGVHCWLARGESWVASSAIVPFSDERGWNDAANYTTLRMGDLDGDGRADLCGRGDDGVYCALSDGSGLGAYTQWNATLSDANSWNLPRFYTTIRLADVDGDGRDDLCARDGLGFGCWLSNGTRFDRRIEGPRWGDEAGWGSAQYYGTIRMADIDRDGRADVCARGAAGIECWLSHGGAFPTRFTGPEWSDGRGWSVPRYWSTLRLADVDGDGRADLCARNSFDFRCLLSTGTSFDRAVVIAPLSDANGWDDISNYATLRAADLDGDGDSDFCARANADVRCWLVDGDEVTEITGPPWSDDSGWSAAQYYETLRLTDFDGDGDADLCARTATGWTCVTSDGNALGATRSLDAMTNADGFGEERAWSTILAGGVTALPNPSPPNAIDGSCGCSAPGRGRSVDWLAMGLFALLAFRRTRKAWPALAVLCLAGCQPVGLVDGDASIASDGARACRGATQQCASGSVCCAGLVCGDTMLGRTCCGEGGAACASGADCCAGTPCTDGHCTMPPAACLNAREPCSNGTCCSGLTCGTTTLGTVCCGSQLAPCATDDGSDCCGDLLCGTTTAGRVCCGGAGAPCATADGSDCCGALLCSGGRCQ